jgi:hypothetical protein
MMTIDKYRINCRIGPSLKIRPSHLIRPFPSVLPVVAIFY